MSEVISYGIAITCSDWTQSQHLLKQLKDEPWIPWIQTSPPIQNQKPSIRGNWLTTCCNSFLSSLRNRCLTVFSSGVLGDQCHFVQLSHGKWGSVGPVGPVGLEISRRAPGQDEQWRRRRRWSQLCSWWSRGVILATAQYSSEEHGISSSIMITIYITMGIPIPSSYSPFTWFWWAPIDGRW